MLLLLGSRYLSLCTHSTIFSLCSSAPINLSLRAIAIPLICGNTVVLKASENSPASQRIVVDLLLEAGLPESVLHFITFGREHAGDITSKIIAHPAVRRINFTGSDIVGRKIATEAAKHLKQCIFELGGSFECPMKGES